MRDIFWYKHDPPPPPPPPPPPCYYTHPRPCYYTLQLTPMLLIHGYFGITRSVSWPMMAWWHKEPGHQQSRYWLCKIKGVPVFSQKPASLKCRKIKYYFTCLFLSLQFPITPKPQQIFKETQLNIFKETQPLEHNKKKIHIHVSSNKYSTQRVKIRVTHAPYWFTYLPQMSLVITHDIICDARTSGQYGMDVLKIIIFDSYLLV